MPRFLHAVAVVLLASLPTVSRASPDTLSQAVQLEQVVTDALNQYGVPGAAIGVWTPHGRWAMTTGLADVAASRPVTPRDHFAIRSITKSFTVTLVLQLVAGSHGAISLDDPIEKFLSGVPNGQIISLRQLANMTSGLYNYTADPAFQQAFGADPTRSWTPHELLDFALHSPSHPPFDFEPGERFEYSNTNTLLLGKFVEAVTGKPYGDVLGERILTPLDLRSTAFLTGTDLPRPAASGYQGTDENGAPDPAVINLTTLSFAGAMAATLHDLAKWGVALAAGELLPAELQRQRFVGSSTADDPASPLYDRYGLGIGEVAGWWGHTGEGVGFEAAVFHQIARGETVAILLNASNAHDVPVVIFCRLLQVLGESPPVGGSRACDSSGQRGTPGIDE
jgi:D-alanyl-D-alanine carboxypeptidase